MATIRLEAIPEQEEPHAPVRPAPGTPVSIAIDVSRSKLVYSTALSYAQDHQMQTSAFETTASEEYAAAVSAANSTTFRRGARRSAERPPEARWTIAVPTAAQPDGAVGSTTFEFAGFKKNRSIAPPSGTRRARGYIAVEPKQPGDSPV